MSAHRRTLPARPIIERIAALQAIAIALLAGAAAAGRHQVDRARPAQATPLPSVFAEIGPFCNVVNSPDGITTTGNCFDSGYQCPLAFEMPIGYGMMKIRLTNAGQSVAVVSAWWHVIVRCLPSDVGPYVTRLMPGETKVVWHAEPAYTFNDKVRFFRWTTDSPRVSARFAGAGCAPADDRGQPGRFRPHPRRADCDLGFARSATWSPWIYLPVAYDAAPGR